jgi:AraC-like DNA-binding protein
MKFLLPDEFREKCLPAKVTAEYAHLVMTHARAVQTSGAFGTILTQTFKGKDYEVWQHHFFLRKDITLTALTERQMLTINHMLKGSPVAKLPALGKIVLEENTAQFFYLPPIEESVYFGQGDYHCVHIVFSPSYIKRLLGAHPELEQLIDFATRKSGRILLQSSVKINSKMKALLEQIIYCRMPESETELNLQSRVLDLLLNYIRKHTKSLTDVPSADKPTLERLQAIKDFIENNIENSLRIATLTRQFGMSESFLYRQFKSHFGFTVSAFIKKARLEKSMVLIRETTTSVNQIASMVGYDVAENFIHAFKNYFGHPPRFYREEKNPDDGNSQLEKRREITGK